MKHIKLFSIFEGDSGYVDFNKEESLNRIDKLFDKLVPRQGAAETVEGEMVRAISRILYRYYNDGDFFFRGYGKETAGSSASYLRKCPIGKTVSPMLTAAQRDAPRNDSRTQYTTSDGYLANLIKIAKAVADYVDSKKGNYEDNKNDSR